MNVLEQERDRRLAATQQIIEQEGLDALVLTSTFVQTEAVAIKYLTNTAMISRRGFAFVARGEMPYFFLETMDEYASAMETSWLPKDHIIRVPDAVEEICARIGALGEKKRIGLYEPEILPAWIYKRWHQLDVEYVDVTRQMTVQRAPKSEYEIEQIKKTSELAIASLEYAVSTLHPGMAEKELMGGATNHLILNGVQEMLLLCATGVEEAIHKRPKDVIIQSDDVFIYSCEFAGPTGYWSQVARTIFMSRRADPEAYKILQVATEAIRRGAEMLRPGNQVGDVSRTVMAAIRELGCEAGHWAGHAMGADLGDGMPITPDCDIEIKKNMVFTLHPNVVLGDKCVFYGDTFLVTDGAAVNLTDVYTSSPYLEDMKKEYEQKRKN